MIPTSDSQASGARLRDLRHHLGLSISDLASAIGTSTSAVPMWERGERKIPATVAMYITEIQRLSTIAFDNRDIRRAVEDRFEAHVPRLDLSSVPDGWLGVVERFLSDVVALVPADVIENLSIKISVERGQLEISHLLLDPARPGAAEVMKTVRNQVAEVCDHADLSCACCGVDGARDGSGWIYPLCDEHRIGGAR